MRLNDLIRNRRLELGLSQVDVQLATGIAQRTISDIERGVTQHPTFRILQSLSGPLKLPIEQLVMASGQSSSEEGAKHLAERIREEDPIAQAVLLELGKLDEETRQVVLSIIRELRKAQERTERQLS